MWLKKSADLNRRRTFKSAVFTAD